MRRTDYSRKLKLYRDMGCRDERERERASAPIPNLLEREGQIKRGVIGKERIKSGQIKRGVLMERRSLIERGGDMGGLVERNT